MTYARSRLYTGVVGVGSLVVLALCLLLSDVPSRLLPTRKVGMLSGGELFALVACVLSFLAVMLPLDVVGGYVLPNRYNRQRLSRLQFLKRWSCAALLQSLLFLATAAGILVVGRAAGTVAVIGLILSLAVMYLALQGWLVRLTVGGTIRDTSPEFESILAQLERSLPGRLRLQVIEHRDPGFTGGVVGLPGWETIVVPRRWIEVLSISQLMAVVRRRVEAVRSGSRFLGIVVALGWVAGGFSLAAHLPQGGVTSVAGLATTCCGFTLWSFLGLLLLPTLSRRASQSIDHRALKHGVSADALGAALKKIDQMQDDEPSRSLGIETIFHPVPALERRMAQIGDGQTLPSGGAWHAARMTLFLSWACLGVLSRAVHCNAGRPELWVMLPSD